MGGDATVIVTGITLTTIANNIFSVHVLKENFGVEVSPAAVFPPTRKYTVSKLYPGSANKDKVALSLLETKK